MSSNNAKTFVDCMFDGGVFGHVFENDKYGVYTPAEDQSDITKGEGLVSIIRKYDPREITKVPIEKLYKDHLNSEDKIQEYLINANRHLPCSEFCKTISLLSKRAQIKRTV